MIKAPSVYGNSFESISINSGLSLVHTQKLYETYFFILRRTKKGSNVEIMIRAIKELKESDPTFSYHVRVGVVTKLVQLYKEEGLIQPRAYPKKRKKPSIEDRVFLTTRKIVNILEMNQQELVILLKTHTTLERSYKAFAIKYNNEHLREYFPLDWDTVSQDIRNAVRSLLSMEENTKVTDLAKVRYASKEEILSHPHFRHFIAQGLLPLKQGKYYFHTAMFFLLQKWSTDYNSLGLILPTRLSRGQGGRNSLQDVLGLEDCKIKTVLGALDIDESVWTKMELSKDMRGPLPLLPNATVFGTRPNEE